MASVKTIATFGRGRDRLKKGLHEGRELLGGIRKDASDLPEIDGHLVDQDQRGLATEQLNNRLVAGGRVRLIALADPLVTGFAS